MQLAASILAVLSLAAPLCSQPRRILLVTHSAGFRHDSVLAARESLASLAPERFEVTGTEDLSLITAARLAEFRAVFFFTSGELALDRQQKADLLAFVRNGGGFAGAHSATDTLYTWPEYGELIGAYFDGHPHAGETDIDIEDPAHPASQPLGNAFRIVDEIYKFRDFSRSRSRVLMTIRSSPGEPGVNYPEYPLDSPLAWCHNYGSGRVFYTALGHFDETWHDPRIRAMLLNVLAWITGEVAGDATPRPAVQPRIDRADDGVAAPGSIVSITGANLTTGSTMTADSPALRLAGTWATLSGRPVRILFASPSRIDVLLPVDAPREGVAALRIASGSETAVAQVDLRMAAAAPRIFKADVQPGQITLQVSGIADPGSARVTADGVELERIAAFRSRPGMLEIVVKKPAVSGDLQLTVESEGRSSSIPIRIE